MTPLRRRMIEDMSLAGLAVTTQGTYVEAVRKLAAFYQRSPEALSEEEVRAYLLHRTTVQGVAQGTFKTDRFGIQFLYGNVLGREWALFSKKGFARQSGSACLCRSPMSRLGVCCAA
jgi:hypothetical protein